MQSEGSSRSLRGVGAAEIEAGVDYSSMSDSAAWSASSSSVNRSTTAYSPRHHRNKSICLQRMLQNGNTTDSVIDDGASALSQMGQVGARTIRALVD